MDVNGALGASLREVEVQVHDWLAHLFTLVGCQFSAAGCSGKGQALRCGDALPRSWTLAQARFICAGFFSNASASSRKASGAIWLEVQVNMQN